MFDLESFTIAEESSRPNKELETYKKSVKTAQEIDQILNILIKLKKEMTERMQRKAIVRLANAEGAPDMASLWILKSNIADLKKAIDLLENFKENL